LQQLTALWQQIQDFSKHLQGLSFTEIRSRLAGYEQQILQIVQQDSGSSAGSATPSQSTGTPTGRLSGTISTDSVAPTGSDQLTGTVPPSTVAPSGVDSTPPATPTDSGSPVPSTSPSPSGT